MPSCNSVGRGGMATRCLISVFRFSLCVRILYTRDSSKWCINFSTAPVEDTNRSTRAARRQRWRSGPSRPNPTTTCVCFRPIFVLFICGIKLILIAAVTERIVQQCRMIFTYSVLCTSMQRYIPSRTIILIHGSSSHVKIRSVRTSNTAASMDSYQ